MKKIVTLIFCVMLILAMAGCGQSPKAADKDTSTQQAIIDKANKAPEKQEFSLLPRFKKVAKMFMWC